MEKRERNYGIELLRIVSMFLVIISHTLGTGGVLRASSQGSMMYAVGWYLEMFAYCCVDIFALISGYVAYSDVRRKTKVSSYIKRWLQVTFYGVVIGIVYWRIMPEVVTFRDVLSMFFQVRKGLYWYFTAYTGLFFIKPLLDEAVSSMSEITARKVFVAVFAVFSCFEIFASQFDLNGGYSVLWLVLLYTMGSIIKKCDIGKNIKTVFCIFGIVLMCTFSWAWKMLGGSLPVAISENMLFSHLSPTLLCAAIFCLITFSRLRIGNKAARVIGFLASGAFAGYLLNTHVFVRDITLTDSFAFLANGSVVGMVAFVIGFAALFVLVSILIDKLRQLLFKVCRIDLAADKVGGWINRLVDKIASGI
ncbi:MAG: acyltransferase family protein [Clostridia bacterium]|nr:acyltransferase family protein [Clostridia bacterium]